MKWVISAEIVAAIMLCIILAYAHKGNLLPTFKNKAFRYCLQVTFVSVITNICSTLLLERFSSVPYALNISLLVIYYLSTPLMGVVYFVYTLATIYEKQVDRILHYAKLSSIPAFVYILIVITNPITGALYYLDPVQGYAQGPWIAITYIIFFIYVFLSVIVVFHNRKSMDRTVCYILGIFPFISGFVIIYQYYYPNYILTGTAATSALLIIYLYLQNKQMFTDTLTNLLNRQEFNKMIDLKVKENAPFYVIVISLKEFKFINDKFGQEIGDVMLLQLCRYLKELLPRQSLYRYGGDEFAVIFSHREEMEQVMRHVMERMKAPWKIQNMELRIQYVLGGISYPDVVGTKEEIIKGLESAVSKAKQEKDSVYCFCTTEMMEDLQKDFALVSVLKAGIEKNSFRVFFQPIYDLHTKRYRKAEALLRLPEGEMENVSPDVFIPIAEENGLIGQITYQVLDKACKFVKEIIRLEPDFVGVSINFSIVQFLQEDLEEKVVSIIEQNEVPFDRIKIEITESMLTKNYAQVLDFMKRMNARGIQFLLDDFGTGYSNIAYVLQVPFHTVKLDKSLIWLAMKDEEARIVVQKLTEAFVNIHRHVLAEGIETKEHIEFTSSCGCDYLQGYYYAKPVCASEALDIIHHTIIASEPV